MNERKLVTFKVAKAIKEAGYPQGFTKKVFAGNKRSCGGRIIFEGYILFRGINNIGLGDYDIPDYIGVWLWLCSEGYMIEVYHIDCGWFCQYKDIISTHKNTPEEAIIEIIDFLVDNNLIKNKYV